MSLIIILLAVLTTLRHVTTTQVQRHASTPHDHSQWTIIRGRRAQRFHSWPLCVTTAAVLSIHVQVNVFQLVLTSDGSEHLITFNYAQLPHRGTVIDRRYWRDTVTEGDCIGCCEISTLMLMRLSTDRWWRRRYDDYNNNNNNNNNSNGVYRVKPKQHAEYVHEMWFRSKVRPTIRTHRQTHTPTDRSTWTTKMVGKLPSENNPYCDRTHSTYFIPYGKIRIIRVRKKWLKIR